MPCSPFTAAIAWNPNEYFMRWAGLSHLLGNSLRNSAPLFAPFGDDTAVDLEIAPWWNKCRLFKEFPSLPNCKQRLWAVTPTCDVNGPFVPRSENSRLSFAPTKISPTSTCRPLQGAKTERNSWLPENIHSQLFGKCQTSPQEG